MIQIQTTFEKKEEAEKLAQVLVEEKLAACVQILPVKSVYSWKEKVESAEEWLCLIKTKRELYADVEKTIKENHSYEIPEIIATEIKDGSSDYLDWINNETK